MDEKTLIRISFITAILGLGFLFLYAEEFNLRVIEDLDSVLSAEEVKLRGKIISLRKTDKAVFLELEGEKIIKTDVILFPHESIYLKEGDYVEIYGEVEEYNNEKEVIASKVVLK